MITIEPGCYYIDFLLDKALADPQLAPHIVADKLKEFWNSGGVRIEDDVAIWEKGNENMNHQLPRTVEEIEGYMAKARGEKEGRQQCGWECTGIPTGSKK